MAESVFSTYITTEDGVVHDVTKTFKSIAVDADAARESIDTFAEGLRTLSWSSRGEVTMKWESEDPPQLFLAFDPAVSDGWVDTIRPLPDIGSA